ncbi:MAG: precorrin-6Y C5,15-methyltransferase (decarboxylating) subunit CbiT [Pelosinus sp.]|nr:precorrin-6Y C5,15-methyltransferase (decarboxylating) subunit CbiT [Pelosinus sp.]
MNPLGIQDEEFIRGNIPMTKQEVRILALAKAKIRTGDVIIDIGAGTGSLSIEAARQSETGQVYAIEREQEGIELIVKNAAKFRTANVNPILGKAPQALNGIPRADVIFVGGSGGHLPEILQAVSALLKIGGRMVITAVTIETLSTALSIMQAKEEFQVEAFGVQVTRIRKVSASNMLQALNPIYIITVTKGEM